ncbi:MAG: hypothetical protein ABL917_01590 [Parcubacteria group bacterium]
MNKKIIITVVVMVCVALYGGFIYGKSKTPLRGQFANGQFPGNQNGPRGTGMMNGGFTMGEIIFKDATSVTIKMQDGSTKIALIATSTQVMKSTSGTFSDLNIGTNITISGTSNSDGSVTAQSVQIRPLGSTTLGRRVNQ